MTETIVHFIVGLQPIDLLFQADFKGGPQAALTYLILGITWKFMPYANVYDCQACILLCPILHKKQMH